MKEEMEELSTRNRAAAINWVWERLIKNMQEMRRIETVRQFLWYTEGDPFELRENETFNDEDRNVVRTVFAQRKWGEVCN